MCLKFRRLGSFLCPFNAVSFQTEVLWWENHWTSGRKVVSLSFLAENMYPLKYLSDLIWRAALFNLGTEATDKVPPSPLCPWTGVARKDLSIEWCGLRLSSTRFTASLSVYFPLYNKPSYSPILIGSRPWSIRGQSHDWRHHHKVFPSAF